MTALLAILMFLLGALVCYLVIINYIGRKAPNSVKGKAYLKKRLSDLKVDISAIPDIYVNEIVALAERQAAEATKSNPREFLSVFTELLDYTVTACYNAQRNGLGVTGFIESFISNFKARSGY